VSRPRLGAVGALAGVVAVGAAAGLAAERYAIGRTRLRPDPERDQPFFSLPADRVASVLADDGVHLHVEEVGPPARPGDPTLVFLHGYTQEMAVWHYQRIALAEDRGARMVFYDHRSHGRSERGGPQSATIDQLGRDLYAVLEQTCPTGPIVLVGHSMGGMTIMALADAHPELFGPRVAAVALLSTSTGKLAQVAFGLPTAVLPVTQKVLPFVTRGMRSRPQVFERGRRLGTDLAFLLSRSWAFGSRDVSPALVAFVEQMLARCPVDVIAEFYDTFTTHDKLAALQALRPVETLVLVGSKDKLTPKDHGQAIADALPQARFVVVEGAGHMVQLERAALVTLHLRALLSRADLRPARTA